MILPRHRIRIAADAAQFDGPAEARLGREPVLWRGSDVQFELAFFEREELLDMSNLASVSVQVRLLDADGAPSFGEGSLLMSASASGFSALTTEDWESGAGAQATLNFAADATRIAPGRHWLVISGQTNDTPGRTLVFAAGTIEVLESGLGGDAAPVVQEIAYTRTESDARYLRQSENLAELADKALAREQLDVIPARESRQLAQRAQGLSARDYRQGGRTTVAANAAMAGWIGEGELLALVGPVTSPAENLYIASGSGWSLTLNDQQLRFTRTSDGVDESFAGGEVPLNRFSWVRVKVADGERPEVWLDGEKLTPSSATALTGTPTAETGVLHIGQKSDGTLGFPGLVARVVPLNFHLTVAEWLSFLASGILPKEPTGSQAISIHYVTNAGGGANLTGTIEDFSVSVSAGTAPNIRVNPENHHNTRISAGWYRVSFAVEFLAGSGEVAPYFRFWDGSSNPVVTLAGDGSYTAVYEHPANANLELVVAPLSETQSLRITGLRVTPLGPLWLGDLGAQPHMVVDRAHGHHAADAGTVALWPQDRDAGVWIEQGLDADGALGFAPGYPCRVTAIAVVADADVTGFQLGTSSGGGEMVSATDLTADTAVELTLTPTLVSAELYASASSWNGASVRLNLRWERVRW